MNTLHPATLTAALLMFAVAVRAADPKAGKKLAALPPAARQTVLAQKGDGRIEDVNRTTEDGEVVYEVDIKRDGIERSFTVAADGRLVSRQVFLNELPPALQAAVRRQAGADKLGEIVWVGDFGDPFFSVETERAGAKRTFSLAPDGHLLAVQVMLEETPAAVRKTITSELAGAKIEELERTEDDDGTVTYQVTASKDGKKREFSVGVAGQLVAEQIELASAPAEAQKAIRERAVNARLERVEKSTEDGETLFEASVIRGGLRHTFIVGADGALQSERARLNDLAAAVQKTVKEQSTGAFLVRVDKVYDDGEAHFQIETRKDGKRIAFNVSPDGTFLGPAE